MGKRRYGVECFLCEFLAFENVEDTFLLKMHRLFRREFRRKKIKINIGSGSRLIYSIGIVKPRLTREIMEIQ